MAQIGTLLSQQGDNMVVGRWLGPTALGVYGRAYNLMVMPASAFGRIINRVLFPVMAQVQDQRDRMANAYERALAIVAMISLPISTFFWVVAPEFIPLFLGPKWTAAVSPFRLFSISLLFRMSSKISDACAKAAGEVYIRAVLQFAYAAMVVIGAIVGQRWGVGGVAVCVSIAMALNWLSMASLCRRVCGLNWSRFTVAHLSPAALAIAVGGGAMIGAQASRAAGISPILTLIAAGITTVIATVALAWLWPRVFLGRHGMWALRQAQEVVGRSRGARRTRPPEPEAIAPLEEARSE
jgi:PST family polysaccharide transporter